MKLIILLMLLQLRPGKPQDMKMIREMYIQGVRSKSVALALLNELERSPKNPLMNGYRGATTLLMAKHVSNPFKKLSYFTRGRDLLEQSIRSSPNNVELHFLRYAIQVTIPRFLNYHGKVDEDHSFILAELRANKIPDANLRQGILSFLEMQKKNQKPPRKQRTPLMLPVFLFPVLRECPRVTKN